MNFEAAPLAFGQSSVELSTVAVVAVILGVIAAFMMGARKETAMFAVFAGIVGVILAI